VGERVDQRALPGDESIDRHRLPSRAVTYWRLWGLLAGVPLAGIAVLAATIFPGPAPVRLSIAALLIFYLLILEPFVVPVIRYRVLWYAVSADEIDLQHGWLVQTRTVIPMNRVQHLDTRHGPIADKFRLATLDIYTAAGKVTLPSLDRDEAADLRSRISTFAHLSDDV
jgi:membrane protein YdbS with pleckstrin-like domain